jgi:hypothetical protein
MGAGGSGKSFVINLIRILMTNIRVCAFTGSAATNVGGRTIDSLLNDNDVCLHLLDALIIDEISLCSAQKLNKLRSAGVRRLLMFGDFNQLPPFVCEDDNPSINAENYGDIRTRLLETFSGYHPDTGALFVFESDIFKHGNIQIFTLKSQFRQSKSESRLSHVLQCMRDGSAKFDPLVRQFFIDRELAYKKLTEHERYSMIHLYYGNKEINAHNTKMFQRLEGNIERVYAHSHSWNVRLDRYGYSHDAQIRAEFVNTTRDITEFLNTTTEYTDLLRDVYMEKRGRRTTWSITDRTRVYIPWCRIRKVFQIVNRYREGHEIDDIAFLCLTSGRPFVYIKAPGDILFGVPTRFLTTSKDNMSSSTFRVGQRVMCTMNSRHNNVFNGLLGTIVELHISDVHMRTDTDNVVVVPMLSRYSDKRVVGISLVSEYNHMPLTGAGAISIHKSQGKTLSSAILFMGACAHNRPGAAYTAMSRCSTEAGLFIGETPHSGVLFEYHAASSFERNVMNRTTDTYHHQIHKRCQSCGTWYLPLWCGHIHRCRK